MLNKILVLFVSVVVLMSSTAFAGPSDSALQMMNPNENSRGYQTAETDYKKILQKLIAESPIKGIPMLALDINSETLKALLLSNGIFEKESAEILDNCVDGIASSGFKQASKSIEIQMLVVKFKTNETAIEFKRLAEKNNQSQIAKFTSYKVIKEETLKMDGFDFIIYRHDERKKGDELTTEIEAVGLIGNTYVEIGFRNTDELTENDILKLMRIISAELKTDPPHGGSTKINSIKNE